MQKPRRDPTKYRDCERVKVHGGRARKLTQQELAAFRAHIQRAMTKSLDVQPYRLEERTLIDRLDSIEQRLGAILG